MSDFALDSHKLMFHPQRVAEWHAGEDVFPIYIEVSLVNKCNYRCCFCAFDYTGYSGGMLEKDTLCLAIKEMAECGVKSLVFAGTGEPLLHPDLTSIVEYAVSCGIDVGLSTNGALLNNKIMDSLVQNLSWIRISFNAGTPEDYAKIHGCNESRYLLVKNNIKKLLELKKEKKSTITIGVQSLILEENCDGLLLLAQTMKTIGVDYFSLKPYSPHPDSIHTTSIKGDEIITEELYEKIESLSENSFSAIVRRQSLVSLQSAVKPYGVCLGLPFLCYLEADGLLYACNTFVGDKSCAYGNINDNSFKEIWDSGRRQKVAGRLTGMTHKQCRQACRLDQINKYLWLIKNPSAHVNFI